MILSRTSQYAVQALIYMATQPQGTPILNKDIAAKLNVPAPYLAKILQSLAKGNLLYSFRGRLGGFCLKEEGGKTTLMDIVLLTEGPAFTQSCLLGLKKCSDETACPVHFRWSPVKEKSSRCSGKPRWTSWQRPCKPANTAWPIFPTQASSS